MDDDPQRRAEAFISAFYLITNDVRTTTRINQHDATRWEAHLGEARRLLEVVFQQRDLISGDDFRYLQDNLNELIEHVKRQIQLAADAPDTPTRPAQHLAEPIRTGRRGRPRIEINRDFLEVAYEAQGPVQLARPFLNASARTIRRRAIDYGIRPAGTPITRQVTEEDGNVRTVFIGRQRQPRQLTEEELDRHVREALRLFPEVGRDMLLGYVSFLGFKVPQRDIRESFIRVNGPPAEFGRRRLTGRRVYSVLGPNSLWHHDGHHKLIRWKLITHGFIDGFSRLVVGLHVVSNNRASTVLSLFQEAVAAWGRPSRVRGDYGVENKDVAQDQESVKGLGRGSYIFGRSVHNIRIERLWVDVMVGYVWKWVLFFTDLEQNHGLNVDADEHIWLLHFLYLGMINEDALTWAEMWNRHPMRLPGGGRLPPINQYLRGMAERGARGLTLDDEAYGRDGDNYGIDWEDLGDRRLVQNMADRREGAGLVADVDRPAAPVPAAPPRWSRVDVEVMEQSPITPIQAEELNTYVSTRVDVNSVDMEVRRMLWVHGLRFFTQLIVNRG